MTDGYLNVYSHLEGVRFKARLRPRCVYVAAHGHPCRSCMSWMWCAQSSGDMPYCHIPALNASYWSLEAVMLPACSFPLSLRAGLRRRKEPIVQTARRVLQARRSRLLRASLRPPQEEPQHGAWCS